MSGLAVKWPMPVVGKPRIGWNIASHLVVPTVGVLSKLFLDNFCRTSVHNRERLVHALTQREKDIPLITTCNHHSCMDDPIIWGILPLRILLRNSKMRWSLAAHDICYTNELHSKFFSLGQSIPVIRGAGVRQQGMEYCIDLLNIGKWVHVYPEGKVNTETDQFIRLKWGIGRLIDESENCPIVIPFWHVGMDEVLPTVEPYRLKFWKNVTVNIGEPMDFSKHRQPLRERFLDEKDRWKFYTDLIQEKFKELREETEQLHARRTR